MWIQLLWALVFTVVAELLRPKPKGPRAASIDDIDFPTAEENRPIPVVFGTCKVAGPNVTWYGDLKTKAIKKDGGLFASDVTVGYQYYLGIEMVLCHGPVEEIVDIFADDISTNIPYSTRTLSFSGLGGGSYTFVITTGRQKADAADVSTYTFFLENLFGGKEKEGGLSGTMRVYKGTQAQTANAYMVAKRAKPLPAYPGFCYAVSEQMYLGTSAYVKPFAFIIKRRPNQLGLTANRHQIGDDANPACMIYEIATDVTWGCGILPALIDVAGLQAIGNTLHAEGMGLSMLCNGGTAGLDLIDEILRHIDGVRYTDPQTGLISFKLAREDYVPASLPQYGPSEITSLNFSRASWSETKNTVKLTYVDRALNYTERSVQAQDLANVQARNGEIDMEDVEYRGFTNSTVATKVVNKVLKTLSYPGAKYNLRMNRKAWALRPGSVFRATWPNAGILDVVLRVIRIDYGDGTSQGIEVDAVEDIFAVDYNAYPVPPTNGWVDPVAAATAVTAQYAFEAPYELIKEENRYGVVVAARSGALDEGYEIHADAAGGVSYKPLNTSNTFTPSGTLTAQYDRSTAALDTVGFTLQAAIDMPDGAPLTTEEMLSGKGLALIQSAAGEEWVAWQTVVDNGDGTFTVKPVMRGVYDTVPLTHALGSRVWLVSEGAALMSDAAFTANGAVTLKVLPFNAKGTLAIASASQFSLTLAQRANKPYPAGKVQVNSVYYPTTTVGNVSLTWTIRHRTVQATLGQVVQQDAANVNATAEGTYTVKVYVNGVLKRTQTLLAGGPYAYLATDRIADSTSGLHATKIGITSVNGSFSSAERFTSDFVMTGLGMTLGEYLGGVAT